MECDRGDGEAVVDQPYAGAHLCERHFRESVRDRFRREMHRQFPAFRGGTVAVALSGGKDSGVALALTHSYFARRDGARVVALTVDEGIEGYRSATMGKADELARRLGVEHRIVRAKEELGATTDAAAARLGDAQPPCGFCGVWRRRLLNRAAREVEADVLVLGFNLDDLAQTVLMNVVRGDVDRLVRMAPHRRRQPGLVPRIAPLATVPEREVYLYARLAGIPFDHSECPYAGRAARNVFREVLWRLEETLPGTRHTLLRTRTKLAEALEAAGAGGAPVLCERCGEPSTGPVCRSCQYLDAAGKPLMEVSGSWGP